MDARRKAEFEGVEEPPKEAGPIVPLLGGTPAYAVKQLRKRRTENLSTSIPIDGK